MRLPTDEEHDAARAWLEGHVEGWTVGQWAALAELLVARAGLPPPSTPFVDATSYVVAHRDVPGRLVEGLEDDQIPLEGYTVDIYAGSVEQLAERLAERGRVMSCRVEVLGRWLGPPSETRTRRFAASVPYDVLPGYLQARIDDQREFELAKAKPRGRKGRAA